MGTLMTSISGIRGIVGDGLDPETIVKYVKAFGDFIQKGKVVIGRDSRMSGEMVKNITAGTLMANVIPPSQVTILKYLKRALISGISVSLGCMRPRKRKPDLERSAIDLGVHRIAIPSNSTVSWAVENGYKISKIDGCCAIPVSLESSALRPF